MATEENVGLFLILCGLVELKVWLYADLVYIK